ncbi:MAG: HAD-IA family hydrolase [Rhodobacteraceae bacterium]|nr:HAD-IA family hydrolase [Paracoccaceae bacterium]
MNAEAMILDFGGVITRTLFETHPETEALLGLAPGSLTWRGPFQPESDPLWQSMQRGEISERDYWLKRTHEVGAMCGHDWQQMSDFVIAARGGEPMKMIRPEALAAIETAHKAGRRLAILSNELDLFYGAELREKLPFLKYFDVITDATHTEFLKPDPRIYQLCLDQLGLPAGACVFVDDQARNIEGAAAVGLQTVSFDVRNPADSYRSALKLLGL